MALGLVQPVVILLLVLGGFAAFGRWELVVLAGCLGVLQLGVLGYLVWSYNAADNDVDLMVTGLASMGLGACLVASCIGWMIGRAWRNRAKQADD